VLTGLLLAWCAPSRFGKSGSGARCQIFAGAAIGSVVLTVVLHLVTKVNYPFSRYCLFVVPLFTIAASAGGAREIAFAFSADDIEGPWPARCGDCPFGLRAGLQLEILPLQRVRHHFRAICYQAIEKDALSRHLSEARVGRHLVVRTGNQFLSACVFRTKWMVALRNPGPLVLVEDAWRTGNPRLTIISSSFRRVTRI